MMLEADEPTQIWRWPKLPIGQMKTSTSWMRCLLCGVLPTVRIAACCLAFTLILSCLYAQKLEVPATNARIALHDETPGHCLAFLSPDRVLWDTAWQETYAYNITGQLVQMQRDRYQAPTMRPTTLSHLSYDAAGHLHDRMTQNDSAGFWINASREMWYYDAQGNDTMNVQLAWHALPGGFGWDTIGGTRHAFTYGPSNQIAVNSTRYWSSGFPQGYWNNLSKLAYFFDGQGQWDSLIVYSSFGNNWVASQRIVQVTWADYALAQRSSYRSQYYQGTWIDAQRTACTYQGLDSDCLTETYDQGTWDTTGRAVITYDAHEHLIAHAQLGRNAGQWEVVNGEQHVYTYDSLGHTTELVDRLWDTGSQNYFNGQRRLYEDYFVAVAPAQTLAMSAVAFPNPAADVIHFQIQGLTGPMRLALYDLRGQLRLESLAPSQAGTLHIPLSETLENGSYVYRVMCQNSWTTGKIVIQR